MLQQDLDNAIRLYEEGAYSACISVLLEEALTNGDPKLESVVGKILIDGMHRFGSDEEYLNWMQNATTEEWELFCIKYQADIEQGVQLLKSASDKGNPFASMNLVTYYNCPFWRTCSENNQTLCETYARRVEDQQKNYVW